MWKEKPPAPVAVVRSGDWTLCVARFVDSIRSEQTKSTAATSPIYQTHSKKLNVQEAPIHPPFLGRARVVGEGGAGSDVVRRRKAENEATWCEPRRGGWRGDRTR